MIPKNEIGVIILFAQQAESAGFMIVSAQPSFPDAIVTRGNACYRAEFEFKASSFIVHEHDPRECDLIICWENNYPDSVLPVLAMSNNNWQETDLTLPSQSEREIAYWERRALRAEKRLKAVGVKQEYVKRNLAGTRALEVLACYTENPERTQASAAQIVGVSRQRIGQLLNKLERAGMLERDNGRVKVLVNLD